jgi:hypothetical protein
MQLQPAIDCSLEWGNVHKVILSDAARLAWYMVIYFIASTNVRWLRNRLTDTENCTECGRQSIVLHGLTECGERQVIWELTCTRIDRIKGEDPGRVPNHIMMHQDILLYFKCVFFL